MTKKEKDAYLFAHLFFGLKRGDGLVLHHKDPTMRYTNPERYKQWNPEDLVVMTRAEHTKLHHTGISKKAWNKGKRNIYTDETKAKMREKKIGVFVGGKSPTAKSVCQYTKDGVLIKVWLCMSDAERECGFSRRNISAVCRGEKKTHTIKDISGNIKYKRR